MPPDDDPFADADPGPDPFLAGSRAADPTNGLPATAADDDLWADRPGEMVDLDAEAFPALASQSTRLAALTTAGPGLADRQRLLGAISTRAGSIRRRRRGLGAAAMGSALVLLAAVLATRGGDAPPDRLATVVPSSTTAQALAPVTIDPTISGTEPATLVPFTLPPTIVPPSATISTIPAGTAPVRSTSTTHRPTTSSTVVAGPGDRADATPGWTNATASCTEHAALPADGGPPANLTLSVTPKSLTVAAGGTLEVDISIDNSDKANPVSFRLQTAGRTDAWLATQGDQAATETVTSTPDTIEEQTVPPGGTLPLVRYVRAVRCADTSRDTPPRVASGSYLVVVVLQVGGTGNALHPWRVQVPPTVTVI